MAAHPDGIHPADMAWMWRRVLEILSWVHAHRKVHGAILPCHILLNTEIHGGRLIDWCYSVESGSHIKAVVPAYESLYPPEVQDKQPATSATDLYMLARCMKSLLGGQPVPDRISRILDACLIVRQAVRFANPWEVYSLLDKALRAEYGPPHFRPTTTSRCPPASHRTQSDGTTRRHHPPPPPPPYGRGASRASQSRRSLLEQPFLSLTPPATSTSPPDHRTTARLKSRAHIRPPPRRGTPCHPRRRARWHVSPPPPSPSQPRARVLDKMTLRLPAQVELASVLLFQTDPPPPPPLASCVTQAPQPGDLHQFENSLASCVTQGSQPGYLHHFESPPPPPPYHRRRFHRRQPEPARMLRPNDGSTGPNLSRPAPRI